jgi:DNA-binding response OmpR family regulator
MGKEIPLRILVADDDSRVRLALKTLLRQDSEPFLVRECSDIKTLAVQIKDFRPDLVLLDWELPGQPATVLLFAFHGLEFKPKVIILSARPESEYEAIAAGADAFVSKGDPPDSLMHTLRSLVRAHGSDLPVEQAGLPGA